MKTEEYEATVIATGKTIMVYRHNDGHWVDADNCKDEYKDKGELTFKNGQPEY